jgi:hypothetical protein
MCEDNGRETDFIYALTQLLDDRVLIVGIIAQLVGSNLDHNLVLQSVHESHFENLALRSVFPRACDIQILSKVSVISQLLILHRKLRHAGNDQMCSELKEFCVPTQNGLWEGK